MNKPKKTKANRWKKTVVGFSVAIAALLLIIGNIVYWTDRTVVDTNHFVSTVGPLITKPPIQSAIATYSTDQLFNNYDVQGFIQNSLPPRASFLAPALTTQVRNYTQVAIKGILANPKVQSAWYTSLSKGHKTIIAIGTNYKGNGTITVSNIGSVLDQQLQGTKLSFLASKHLPPKFGNVTVATVGWLPVFHRVLTHINLYLFINLLLFILFSTLAIVLAKRKMFMVVKLGIVYAGSMLLTVIAINGAKSGVVSSVSSTYQSAVETAYTTITTSLVSQTTNLLVISLLVAAIAWVVMKFEIVEQAKPAIKKLSHQVATKTSGIVNP